MKMQFLLLLFLCYTFSVTRSQIASMFRSEYSGFCCNNDTGPAVQSAYATLAQVVGESPIYEQVVTNSFYTQMLDNVCHTFYQFDNSTYLRCTGLTYADGSVIIEKFIMADIPQFVGVFKSQGLAQIDGSSTIIYDEVYLGKSCPDLRIYYRNIIAGRCDIVTYATLGDIDYVHADSPNRVISDDCKRQVAAVASSQKFKGTCLTNLPNKEKRNCVTKLNGASCINADKVLAQDSYSLPDDSPCQSYDGCSFC